MFTDPPATVIFMFTDSPATVIFMLTDPPATKSSSCLLIR